KNRRQNTEAIISRSRRELSLDETKKYGNTVEEAVRLALEDLGATEDEIDYEVLEEPSRGFLGFGSKLALVRVTRKIPTAVEEKPAEAPVKKVKMAKPYETSGKPYDKKEGESGASEGGKKKKNRRDRDRDKERSKEKAPAKSAEALIDAEPAVPAVDPATLTAVTENSGLEFLENVVKEMGLDLSVKCMTDGKDLFFTIEGPDSGTIIGKRGATLDAIQYLTSLVVNKGGEDYVRVVVDAENYRAKREKALEKLAVKLADKVVRTRRSFKLEPMNPYERKVIHATLQKDSRVTTRSEGQDPSRRVIIELK
ncbi:MAG: protein jag, partial [Firmicutes bacterium]|nr:protein jag [Bacillota bacterium]